ncbi:MAG: hypothetical protein RJA99_1294 [Pseudomonadota bacterium]|jgi:hypothetical protein
MSHRAVPVSRPAAALSATVLLLALAACGGGDPGGPAASSGLAGGTSPVQGTGGAVDDRTLRTTAAGGTTFSSGIVAKGGIVNGVAWDDSRATVADDRGRRGLAMSDGRRVALRGEPGDDRGRGVVDRIRFLPELRGTVTAADASAPLPAFQVGGMRVGTDESTVWADGLRPDALTGRRVEVHGLRDAAGGLVATRVEPIDDPGLVDELRGVVGAAPSGGTFPIAVGAGAPVTVRFSAAGTAFAPSGCDASALAAGRTVEVHGAFTADRVFTAQRIDCEDLLDDSAGVRAGGTARHDMTGLLAGVDLSSRSIRLGSETIVWDDSTGFRRGSGDDLVSGARIEVEGVRGADGRHRAREIRFEHERTVVQGRVEAVNPDGTLRILGRTVRPGAGVRIDASVAAGAAVRIRGGATAAGVLIADEIGEPSGRDGREFVQARVTAKTASTITLLGQPVSLPQNALYRRVDGTAFPSLQAFLDAVVARPEGGSLVKVRGTPLSSRIDEVEFER